MPALTEEHKAFIVTSLACFNTLRQVIADLQEVYGVTASTNQVQFYDPTRGSKGKRLAKKWKAVFDEARAQFVTDTASVGVAHQSYRLRVLQRMLEDALDGKESSVRNKGFVLTLLEQGAKETGGAFTNRRELTGKGGGPIETAAITLEQWKANAAARLAEAQSAMDNFDGADD